MTRTAAALCLVVLLAAHSRDARGATPSGVVSTFELSGGAILDSTFGPPSENWIAGLSGLLPNSGAQFFESDNGNAAHNFEDQRYAKSLGGNIENTRYDVSFFIAANKLGADNLQAVVFADFDSLVIGGAGGTMQWTSHPDPIPGAGWVKWQGIYTPSASDIGTPFQFRMIVDIDARRSLALDGPMSATAVPEPTGGLLAAAGGIALAIISARRRGIPHLAPGH